MEIRDLYDKDRKPTGETIFKNQEIPKGKYILVMMVVIENSKGELLLQKRSKQKGGKYGFTGGHAKTGEDSIQGIISETREEIGLELKPEEIELLKTERVDEYDVFHDVFYVKKDIDKSSLTLQEEKVEDANWYNKDQINEIIQNDMFFENHIDEYYEIMKILKEREKWELY